MNDINNIVEELINKLETGVITDYNSLTKIISEMPLSLNSKAMVFESVRPTFEKVFIKNNVENSKTSIEDTPSLKTEDHMNKELEKTNEYPINNNVNNHTEEYQFEDYNTVTEILPEVEQEIKEEVGISRTRIDVNNNHGFTFYKFFIGLMITAIIVLGVATYILVK